MTQTTLGRALFASLASLALICLPGCSGSGSLGGPTSGGVAPNFKLKSVDGSEYELSDLKGSVVLLDFWATWCPPCRASLPHLQKISTDTDLRNKGLKVFAVNCREDKQTVADFLSSNHYTFTTLLDTGTAAAAYGASSIPMTVIIGKDGLIRTTIIGGGEENAGRIDQAVKDALK